MTPGQIADILATYIGCAEDDNAEVGQALTEALGIVRAYDKLQRENSELRAAAVEAIDVLSDYEVAHFHGGAVVAQRLQAALDGEET